MISALVRLLLNSFYFVLSVPGGAGAFPRPLTGAEEEEYLNRAAAGDISARNKLIEHNLRLVAHIVKKYYSTAMDTDDLISIGTIGLIKAVSGFDAGRGVRLATYAARCIENEILMYFRSLKKQAQETSLSEPIDGGDGDGGEISFMDVISGDDSMLEQIDDAENYKLLRKCVQQSLDERERRIIIMRYGINGEPPLTQRETAERCKISRSYVSRIEKRALAKLSKAFSSAC